MSVKFFVAGDIDQIISVEPLVREALAESRFGRAKFAPEKFRRVAERAAADTGRNGGLIANVHDEPAEFLCCKFGESWVRIE